MPVPVAIALGLLAGTTIAWVARGPLRETSQPIQTRYGAVAALFGATALMPACVALFMLEPAWALMYLAHPDHSAIIAWPVVVLLPAVSPIVGLHLSSSIARTRYRHRMRGWTVGVVLLLLLVMWMGVDRLVTVADYEVFHYGPSGDGRSADDSLASSAIFAPVLAIGALVPLLLTFSLLNVQRHVELTDRPPAADPFETAGGDSPEAAA